MADPELEWGLVFNADGSINVLRSPCFDVGFEDETTVEEYLERVVPILASIYDRQLSKHTWSLDGHLRLPSPPATFPPTKLFGALSLVVTSFIAWIFYLRQKPTNI
ncbi:hypothetical protein MA16_Dca007130 [Dendrobium catenatum]|uniref:Uncharacterized protein n=1 Tax=Dendrobium catenatum TaxID=906689 RepID=A0A2I0W410_9ASPA|nr:hypothetical protein MA16_Dca007130 [Dendrobium catenatum]